MKSLDIPIVITPTLTLPPREGEGNSRVSGWALFRERRGGESGLFEALKGQQFLWPLWFYSDNNSGWGDKK